MMNKAYNQMTPAERTAKRIAENRAIEQRIQKPVVTIAVKVAVPAQQGIRRDVSDGSAPFVFRNV
jgi:hypothetical protein